MAENLERGQVTGPHRTLTQDVSFGIGQLVEIAIRALSPADVRRRYNALLRLHNRLTRTPRDAGPPPRSGTPPSAIFGKAGPYSGDDQCDGESHGDRRDGAPAAQ